MNTLLVLPFPIFSTHKRPRLHYYTRINNANLHITAAIRRHKRRQPHIQRGVPLPTRPDDRTEIITFDIKQMRQRAEEAVKRADRASVAYVGRLKGAATELWEDLRRCVVVSDQGFVIVVRRSSLQFLAGALIFCVFVVVASKLARAWVWERGADGPWIVRRDRSLGGREVVVGRARTGAGFRSTYNKKGFDSLSSPLASNNWESRSEKELMKHKQKYERPRKAAATVSLPSWWPPPDIPPSISPKEYESAQFLAKTLVKVIANSRMTGRDFSEDEILQLRQICKSSGVTVSFQTANVRDSLYRAAIDIVLTTCSSSPSGSSLPRIGGEEATRFIAGLAGNIGIKVDRATTMVNAAVAARTRSTFLQAWAWIMQGKISEAQEAFVQISRIHLTFPSKSNSPEIEMVAEGLKNHLKLEERKRLLNMFTEVCGDSNQRIAVEALGLVSSWEGTNKF